jgi:hypothetical protein
MELAFECPPAGWLGAPSSDRAECASRDLSTPPPERA